MNPIAGELNAVIEAGNPNLMTMLSQVGRQLFFPKGILSQSAEAKEKAHRINATIGIAKEEGAIMCLESVTRQLGGLAPENSITYAPSFGIPQLRAAWQIWQRENNPTMAAKDTSLPVVTCGITHGVSLFADVWLDPGDVVVLPEMMWGNYNMILGVRNGVRVSSYNLFAPDGTMDLTSFESQIRKEAESNEKVTVLLNFPQNPSGYTATKDEGARICDILTAVAESGTQVLVVFDDAYYGLFYDEESLQESLFAELCDRHPRLLAVKLDGATKENYVWGLRIGFITYGIPLEGDPAPVYDALERKTAGCIRGNISNASHIGQTMVLQSLQSDTFAAEHAQKQAVLKARAMKIRSVLADPKYADVWDVYPFNSGYFMCLRLKTVEAETLRVHLLDKYGVGLIALGGHNLRVAFSCIDEGQVQELFDTILQGIADLS